MIYNTIYLKIIQLLIFISSSCKLTLIALSKAIMLQAPPEIATITRYTADTPYIVSPVSSPSMIVLFIFEIELSSLVKELVFRFTTTLMFHFTINHLKAIVLNRLKYIFLGPNKVIGC